MKLMKLTILMATIGLTVAILWQPVAEAVGDPTVHHDLELELFPAQGRLEAVSQLTLPQAGASARLFLSPQARVSEVALNGASLPHNFTGGILDIRLPTEVRGRSVTLAIHYAGRFTDQPPQDPVMTEDPSFGVAAAISEQGTFLSGGSGWYPDPRLGKATWQLSVTAPPGYLAVTAGRLVEQTTTAEYSRSVWEEHIPLTNLTVSAGPYEVRSIQVGEIPVSTYFYPHSQDLAANYLEATREYLELYQELFGTYPFEKFAVVENFFPTGYGFPSWTLLGSRVIRLPFILETSLGHEIAHSWWGNGVRVDIAQGNWSEGLTTYVADYLYLERSSAEQARDYRLRILRDYAALVPPELDFPLARFLRRTDRPSQAVGYGKAAMIFHMLRHKVGEEIFWGGLREMAETRLFDRVNWDDFASLYSRLGDTDLGPFFEQWVRRPGAPILSLEDVQVRRDKDQWHLSGRLSQQEPPFVLQLPLTLETEGESVVQWITLDDHETHFTMTVADAPRRLLVDPDAHLFRRLHPTEIPASVNSIRGSGRLLAVLAEDLPAPTAEAARLILQALRQQDVRIFEEGEVCPEQLVEHDVLFLGLPRRFADPLFDGTELSVDREGFAFAGQRFDGAQAALFAAVTPRDAPDTHWAYFIPNSPESASDAARRIPHYGRDSYLIFDQGENRARGTWDIRESPLIRNFNFLEAAP
ncbi:M1 family metallopeptidase [Desulfurivibrio alkaliphilus]|uniref:Peptidase M1 membrane alanine aminopeptidase n=1 Tax=Desulfurivibrio alkaliphilus (strain DSM 19089 / UNIQEM U267 / AHT2) TaxID=589865 RepID=D6Z5U5_DESAT|nr:M1 family aminopeptidase [Desulfurivibrio alkaliphilus]ADH84827.1 Peptidase M1 membrane alanine aminopeptidase [Desulfurivibrio alkaliphilus AHT 2]